MPECLSASEIDGFVRGTLDAPSSSRVQAHLSECAACRDFVDALAAEFDPRDAPTIAHDTRTRSSPGSSARELGGVKLIFPPSSPRRITGYEILSKLHEGGQGIVYKAVQQTTQRVVAIKVLRRGSDATRQQRQRFEREVKLSANLKHPHIVTIYESGSTSDGDYLAMEYIDGVPLDEYVRSNNLGRDDVLRLFAKVADAVGFAHRQGVTHRDLKPGNILVGANGEPCVLDFGLAKAAGHSALDGDALTVTSEFMGTPAYASPEQIKGDHARVDTRSDIYSLGVILYRLVTRKYPYEVTQDLAATYRNIAEVAPVLPSRIDPSLGTAVDTVLLQTLAKDPERRYQTAGELATDLERLIRGEATSARKDNAIYVLRTRCTALVNTHRVVAGVVVALVATLLAQGIGAELLFRWTSMNTAFERFLVSTSAPVRTAGPFGSVRVIGIMDETRMGRIAASEGLTGVAQRNTKSFRRLHGRLMEKLTEADVGVVGWDIKFEDRTEFDADLVKGIHALNEVGTDVVVGVHNWHLDGDGLPPMSDEIVRAARWGCATGTFTPAGQWWAQLAIKRGLDDPRASLGVEVYAAFRHPGHESTIVLDRAAQSARLLYWNRAEDVPRARRKIDAENQIRLTTLRPMEESNTEFKLLRDDLVGIYGSEIPPQNVLIASTIEYGSVFEADATQLRTWFAGKVVLIGDLRFGGDHHKVFDGRNVAGVHAHAAMIDTLIEGLPIRLPRSLETYLFTSAAALIGVVVASRTTRRPWRCTAVSVGFLLCVVVASVLAYRTTRLMFNPSVPVLAFFLAGLMALLLPRRRRASGS